MGLCIQKAETYKNWRYHYAGLLRCVFRISSYDVRCSEKILHEVQSGGIKNKRDVVKYKGRYGKFPPRPLLILMTDFRKCNFRKEVV